MANISVEKRLIKIEIEDSGLDLNDLDTSKVEVDREMLHPYYKPRVFKAPQFLSKEDKCKISIEIDKYIQINRNILDVSNRVPFLQNNRNTQQNESEETERNKFKRNRKSKIALCSSTCIIGWDILG